jgi:hypothetical protein
MFLLSVLLLPLLTSVVGLPASCCGLHYFCNHIRFCWRAYCDGRPVIAFIPAVACISAVEVSHAIAVILAVAYCRRHYCCFHPCCSGTAAVAGVPVVPDVLNVAGLPAIVASLVFLAFLLLL